MTRRHLIAAILLCFVDAACIDESLFGRCGTGWYASDPPLFLAHDPTASGFSSAAADAIDLWTDAVPNLWLDGGALDIDCAYGTIVGLEGVDGDRGEAYRELADCHTRRAIIRIPFDSPRPDRRIAHEMGHVVGLVHSANPDSLMYPDSSIGGTEIEWEIRLVLHALVEHASE